MTDCLNAPNREEWLGSVARALRSHFSTHGYSVPDNVKMTCGFPSRSAISRKRKRIGECWDTTASEGNVFEIFVSPVLSDPLEVAATLAHELVHATVGLAAKHKAPFKKCALAIGLQGKMTATEAGPDFIAWFNASDFGPYPHARLNASSAPKKQTTRMIKCECPECADAGLPYIVRLSNKAMQEVGLPICPLHQCEMVEG